MLLKEGIYRWNIITYCNYHCNLIFFQIDPKACNPRSMQKQKKNGNWPKVFLGGLPSNLTETDLRNFFSRYGAVMEVVIMFDQEKKKSRGELFFYSQSSISIFRTILYETMICILQVFSHFSSFHFLDKKLHLFQCFSSAKIKEDKQIRKKKKS